MLNFNLIVAVDAKNGIGTKGQLPWHLPADLRHFKEITIGKNIAAKKNVVVMGRKTWDSIPEKFRPLPQRLNIVLTRDKNSHYPAGVLKMESFEQAFEMLESDDMQKEIDSIYVIGGQTIFEQAINDLRCQKIYVTHISKTFDCDTFFPPFNQQFEKIYISPPCQYETMSYSFAEYLRKSSQNSHA